MRILQNREISDLTFIEKVICVGARITPVSERLLVRRYQ